MWFPLLVDSGSLLCLPITSQFQGHYMKLVYWFQPKKSISVSSPQCSVHTWSWEGFKDRQRRCMCRVGQKTSENWHTRRRVSSPSSHTHTPCFCVHIYVVQKKKPTVEHISNHTKVKNVCVCECAFGTVCLFDCLGVWTRPAYAPRVVAWNAHMGMCPYKTCSYTCRLKHQ